MATHTLWSEMSPLLAHEILLSTQKGNKKLYRTAVEIMAPAIGRRVPKVLEMPKVERHAVFTQLLSQPQSDALSFNLLSQWFVRDHVELLCAWLDALGIAHDDQGCADTFPAAPDKAALEKALNAVLKAYDPTLVKVYLTTFNDIDDVDWKPLTELLESDARLQLEPAEGSSAAEASS